MNYAGYRRGRLVPHLFAFPDPHPDRITKMDTETSAHAPAPAQLSLSVLPPAHALGRSIADKA